MKQDREGEDVPSAPGEQVLMAHVELVRRGDTVTPVHHRARRLQPLIRPGWPLIQGRLRGRKLKRRKERDERMASSRQNGSIWYESLYYPFLLFSRGQAVMMLTPCVLSTGSCHARHGSLLIVAQQHTI